MFRLLLDDRERGDWQRELFEDFALFLSERGLETCLEEVASFELEGECVGPRQFRLKHSTALLQRLDDGRFAALDCHDWVTPFDIEVEDLARDPRCWRILKCQFRRQEYREPPLDKFQPWTYFETHPRQFQGLLDELRQIRGSARELYFRGNTEWERRDLILPELARRGLVIEGWDRWIGYDDYHRESSRHRMVLGLPGMGNVCHREIEAFGAGVPVLMPIHKNELHDPLIPDHHYLGVDVDTLLDTPERIGEAIESRWRATVDDPLLLAEVADNARQWYDRNVRAPRCYELTQRLLELEP